jgi:hypothetical protein
LDAKEKAKEKDKHTSGTKNRSAANMMQVIIVRNSRGRRPGWKKFPFCQYVHWQHKGKNLRVW